MKSNFSNESIALTHELCIFIQNMVLDRVEVEYPIYCNQLKLPNRISTTSKYDFIDKASFIHFGSETIRNLSKKKGQPKSFQIRTLNKIAKYVVGDENVFVLLRSLKDRIQIPDLDQYSHIEEYIKDQKRLLPPIPGLDKISKSDYDTISGTYLVFGIEEECALSRYRLNCDFNRFYVSVLVVSAKGSWLHYGIHEDESERKISEHYTQDLKAYPIRCRKSSVVFGTSQDYDYHIMSIVQLVDNAIAFFLFGFFKKTARFIRRIPFVAISEIRGYEDNPPYSSIAYAKKIDKDYTEKEIEKIIGRGLIEEELLKRHLSPNEVSELARFGLSQLAKDLTQ